MDFKLNAVLTALCLSSLLVEFSLGACPTIVSRKGWQAKPATNKSYLKLPVPYVAIHHTVSPGVCKTTDACKKNMRSMQNYHQGKEKWSDIGYNFCIGGDGKAYEGRGWGVLGAHAKGFNPQSLGICFFGDYRKNGPSKLMVKAASDLIQCGVSKGYISKKYGLVGHRQVFNTECPGAAFYKQIQKWPHWTKNVKKSS